MGPPSSAPQARVLRHAGAEPRGDGLRRVVAATAATPSGGSPTAARARCASAAVAPVVITSSVTTRWTGRPARASRATAAGRARRAPARLAARPAASRPAWSARPRRRAEQGHPAYVETTRAQDRSGDPGDGRGRVVTARPGRGGSRRHRHQHHGTGIGHDVGQQPGDGLGQQVTERPGQGQLAVLLVAEHQGAHGAVVGRGRPRRKQPGRDRARPGRPRPRLERVATGRAEHAARPVTADAAAAEHQVVERGGQHGSSRAACSGPDNPGDRRLWTSRRGQPA